MSHHIIFKSNIIYMESNLYHYTVEYTYLKFINIFLHNQFIYRILTFGSEYHIQYVFNECVNNDLYFFRYQKTESVIKSTAEKTTSLFGGLTSKLGQMRNSESFRSFEEKMGSAYENVKVSIILLFEKFLFANCHQLILNCDLQGKVSRSNSEQSFEECLNENKDRRKSQPVATSPTIPENMPLP